MNVIVKGWNALLGGAENIRSAHNALQFLTQADYAIHAGKGWLHGEKHSALGAGASASFLIQTNSVFLRLSDNLVKSTGNPVDIDFYEGVIVSSLGAPTRFLNMDRSNPIDSVALLFSGPVITTTGTPIDYGLITAGNNQGGTGGELHVPWLLANDKDYLITITNNDNSAVDFEHKIFAYEVD